MDDDTIDKISEVLEILHNWRDNSRCQCGSSATINDCLYCDMEEAIFRLNDITKPKY